MVDDAAKVDVKDQAAEVANVARDQAGQVAGTMKEQATYVAGDVKAQGREVVDRTKEQLRHQGEEQARQAARSLRTLADETRALAEGRPDEAGPVANYVRQAGERLEGVAQRVEERGAQGMVEDLERFGRRRPGMFLVGAALGGFVAGRLIRGAAAGSDDRQVGSQAPMPGTAPDLRDPGTAAGWGPDQTVPVRAFSGDGG
jgi:hypothetical protein